ncbi:MAG: hypothetical protein IT356_12800 [Gemmatimonadaceae bacterium]|nr:hypothetical protein [Gemmatimonadaceae bacterium]
MNIENALDLDFITLEDMLYFKANEIPTSFTTVLAAYGIDPTPFLNSWISYPIEELDTESKSVIDKKKDTQVDTSQLDKLVEVMQTDVLPRVTVETPDDVENTYKLNVNLTDQEIKSIMRKLSEEKGLEAYLDSQSTESQFDEFEVSFWVDKDTFLMRKMQAYTVLSEGALIDPAKSNVLGSTFGLTQSKDSDLKMHLAITMNFSRYGETFDIKAPDTSESIEEFVGRISQSVSGMSTIEQTAPLINPTAHAARTRDVKRKSYVTQLGHATTSFYTAKRTYPSNTNFWVQELVSAGELSSVPEGIEYTAVQPCTKAVVQNTWCYDTNTTGFIAYTRLEDDSECPIIDSTDPQSAWYVYSSTDRRGGTVCQVTEPTVGAQTFVK